VPTDALTSHLPPSAGLATASTIWPRRPGGKLHRDRFCSARRVPLTPVVWAEITTDQLCARCARDLPALLSGLPAAVRPVRLAQLHPVRFAQLHPVYARTRAGHKITGHAPAALLLTLQGADASGIWTFPQLAAVTSAQYRWLDEHHVSVAEVFSPSMLPTHTDPTTIAAIADTANQLHDNGHGPAAALDAAFELHHPTRRRTRPTAAQPAAVTAGGSTLQTTDRLGAV